MHVFKIHRECGTDDSIFGGGIPSTSFRAIQKRGRSFWCYSEHLNKEVVRKIVGIQYGDGKLRRGLGRNGKIMLVEKETSR